MKELLDLLYSGVVVTQALESHNNLRDSIVLHLWGTPFKHARFEVTTEELVNLPADDLWRLRQLLEQLKKATLEQPVVATQPGAPSATS